MTAGEAPAPPRHGGGWWHNYVCPVHGTELDHGDLLAGEFPGGHCPHGCRVDTAQTRGAWAVLAHQACARRLRLLARRGATRPALAGLRGYARDHAELTAGSPHEQPPGWMVPGRMFQQALTEAVWATSIGETAWFLSEAGVGGLGELVPLLDRLADLARDARAVLVARGEFRSNYVAWFNAAGALCAGAGATIRRDAAAAAASRSEWLDGPCGLWAHALAATREDGWEWEGSTYYHGFVLRAYLLAMRGVDPEAAPPEALARIRDMHAVLERIATPGGLLPALHDGPYRRPATAVEWLELCALVHQLFGLGPRLTAVQAVATGRAGPGHDRLEDRLTGWFPPPGPSGIVARASGLPGGQVQAAVTVFADTGYAILDGDGMHAVLDFGPHGGSHGHLDKLALYLYGDTTPWQPDPGQVPYGNPEMRAYYRATASHPTFLIDGEGQQECAGELVEATESAVTVAVDSAYPGVRAVRHVGFLAGGALLDVLAVRCDRRRRVSVVLRPDVELQVAADGNVTRSRWLGEQTLHGTHVSEPFAAPRARPGPGPSDDPQRVRVHLDWTVAEKEVRFVSVYRVNAPVTDADAHSAMATADRLGRQWWGGAAHA